MLQLIHLDFLGDIEESEIITISSLKLKSDDDNSTDKEEDKENNQDETSNGYRLPLAGASVSVNNTSNRDYRISYSNLFQPLALCDAYNTLAITEDYAGYVIVFGDNVSGRFEINCNDNAEYLFGIDHH